MIFALQPGRRGRADLVGQLDRGTGILDSESPAGQHVPITVSLGVASYPDHARTKGELVICSDTALYYSKETGRNRATLYSAGMKSDEMLEKKKKKKEEKDREKG